MSQRLIRFAVHRTSLVVAVLMAVVATVFVIPAAIAMAVFGRGAGPSAWLLLLAPLSYFVTAYVSAVVFTWGYNRIAGPLGGIEVVWSPPSAPSREAGEFPRT